MAELEKAKEEGEQVARERARRKELEEEVRDLKRDVPPQPEPDRSELLRIFHTPSGNVSCAITADGAFCTVNSLATTFRIEGGAPGRIERGSALPVEYGRRADHGSTVSAGTISCTIPRSVEARGVICSDLSSGHGFEASLVRARQKAY